MHDPPTRFRRPTRPKIMYVDDDDDGDNDDGLCEKVGTGNNDTITIHATIPLHHHQQ